MADLVDEVFGNVPAEPEKAPTIEPTPEPQVEQPVEPEPAPEPPQVQKDEERHVPLRTFLDQRDEAKEWRRKAEALQAQQQPKATVPDAYDNPDEFASFMEARLEERLTAQRFEISDQLAREKHGDEAVEAAVQWASGKAQADPGFAASYMRDKNPINWIVAQHKRDAIVSALPNDVSSLDELIEREIAKRGLTAPTPAPTPVVAAPVSRPAAPPRSIASDVAASGSAPSNSDPFAGLNALFDKR